MDLEFKHITPYSDKALFGLFYKEKDIVTAIDFEHGLISSMNNGTIELKYFKPILRPLSDLTKEIVIGKEKFVPAYVLFEKEHPRHKSKSYWHQEYYNYIRISHNATAVDFKIYTNSLVKQNPIFICEYLFNWHFDVFGLIPKNLAIDINTI